MVSMRRLASLGELRGGLGKGALPEGCLNPDKIGHNLCRLSESTLFLSHLAPIRDESSKSWDARQSQGRSYRGHPVAVKPGFVEEDSTSELSTSAGSSDASSQSSSPRDLDFSICLKSPYGLSGAGSEEERRWLRCCNNNSCLHRNGLTQDELDMLCVVSKKTEATKPPSQLPRLDQLVGKHDLIDVASKRNEKQRPRKLEHSPLAGSPSRALRTRRDRSAPVQRRR